MNEIVKWRCPSNIALVKYWGKKGNQLPCNASVSMTLQNAFTEITLRLLPKKQEEIELEYLFEGQKNEAFQKRVLQYLDQNRDSFPVLNDHALVVDSRNSFPHSTGIASSASSFGALALALLAASGYGKEDFLQRASYLARLGSGSACRSLYPDYALWGKLNGLDESSDEYAIPVDFVHENFRDMRDAILIVDDSPKKVSSSKGHSLMKGHVYAQNRFEQANRHCSSLLNIIKNGDFEHFVQIIEQEALALHAMMMTSVNYYLLMKPGTISAIEKIMNFRKETRIPVCFTLDAGPNVHILYPGKDEQMVGSFLKSELESNSKGIIFDRIGMGPEKLI